MEQEIEVWIGLDVGKRDHHATVLDGAGGPVFDRACRNEEAALEQLLEDAGPRAALVIDQPGSIGTLAVALARRRGIPVAYVPGLVMRRASQLYPGGGEDRPARQLRDRRHRTHPPGTRSLAGRR